MVKTLRTWTENVVTVTCGIGKPAARNASATAVGPSESRGGRQQRHVHQVGETDLAAARPRALHRHGETDLIVEQHLGLQMLDRAALKRACRQGQRDIDRPLLQLGECPHKGVYRQDAQLDLGVAQGKALDHRRQDPGRHRFRASDPDFAKFRIGQALDILDARAQFVERDLAAPHQRGAIDRELDAARSAIEHGRVERVLERGDRLGDRGLRHAEARAGLGHAAVLHDRKQDVQVPQPDAPADPAVPIDGLSHKWTLMSLSQNSASSFSSPGGLFNLTAHALHAEGPACT
jgi:hypothetical protein